ncbi:type II secretion system protein GspD [Acidovorax sp. Root267]|uniref:type II secretion system secretin GspD n=1 Tax=Acidovorax sp. Root267 TaxID=1736505 RepID=UPI00070FE959|nr:type II secretion system secretin GspD [Acidovorax sp. Root267]KRD16501.1 type II secretion system protein GspD [Acidovorax sp. Root267]
MNIRPSILLLALLAAGCASTQGGPAASSAAESKVTVAGTSGPSQAAATVAPTPVAPNAVQAASSAGAQAQKSASSSTKLYPGNDQFFKRDKAPVVDPVLAKGDKVALNFENVTVSNLAVALLGDLLKLNYTIDAGGDTVVSLHTRQPLARNQVLDVLDAVLLPHDLAIVRDNAGVYHVTKRTVTLGARPVVGASKFKDLSGAGTVIVPLNHIAAAEMAKILAPIAPREAIVYVDSIRNLLVLQGSKAQLGGWLEMVEAFDVDFLSGMSLGVFVLENANVNVVRDALQAMLGSDKSSDPYGGGSAAPAGGAPNTAGGAAAGGSASGAGAQMATPLGGLIRVFPVERLNALVVVTPRSHLLAQVETWIRRLDRPTDTLEASLFVYPVQNGSALQLAEMLNGLFGGQSGQAKSGGVAAGSAPTQFSQGAGMGGSGLGTGNTGSSSSLYGNTGSAGTGGSPMGAALGAGGNRASSNNTSLTSTSQLDGNVRVVADEKRNALLIRAPRTEYRRIEQALRELDRAPMQVLIEASIVEVSLTGNLEYGVEWYLQNGLSRGRQGEALLDLGTSGIGPKVPGFSYSISKADVVRATLNAVATKSQVRLLSSPSILVLNNHTANIQVGQQQPILSSTAAATGGNFITQSITYKDTGVLLSVTPSVNAGGLISMDISQQVTDVGEEDDVTKQRSFQTRQIQTRVAVRSGESIVLGGLIRENDSNTRSGLPGLADVPLLGALFSNTSNLRNRTELLVLMTPRALEDDDQLRSASAEMRERMRSLSLQAQPMSFRPPDTPLQPSR